jgi:hypothetical protein
MLAIRLFFVTAVILSTIFAFLPLTQTRIISARLINESTTSRIHAAGDCMSMENGTCSFNNTCTNNGCTGDPYNPYQDCISDCYSNTIVLCTLLHGQNTTEYEDCVFSGSDQCFYVDCESESLYPREDVRACTRTIASHQTRRMQGYNKLLEDLDESDFDSVTSVEDHCRTETPCWEFCVMDGNWICYTDPGAAPQNIDPIKRVTGSQPGECEKGE